jgi:flagellar secretion chaperone FliS
MSYSNHAAAYRERDIATASPGKLLVLVYDHILANLARAGVADANKLVEARVEAIAKARDGIIELLATIDMEQGGQIAQQLSSLYTFMLQQLADAGTRFDERKVTRIAGMIRDLRDAFAAISDPASRTTAA